MRDGDDYRFVRAHGVDAGMMTRYWINPHFDPDPKTATLDIPNAAWVRFRESLREAGCDRWREAKVDDTGTSPFWILRVEYPDMTISASGSDAASMAKDFAPVREALHELTAGNAF